MCIYKWINTFVKSELMENLYGWMAVDLKLKRKVILMVKDALTENILVSRLGTSIQVVVVFFLCLVCFSVIK